MRNATASPNRQSDGVEPSTRWSPRRGPHRERVPAQSGWFGIVYFMTQPLPRYVTSALVEEGPGWVTVTWGFGDVIPGEVEYFGYGVDYFGLDGNGGKRFGVRFHEKPSAHVFEWSGATEANYEPDSIAYDDDRLVVHYRDADIGLPEVGTIRGFSHLNGADVQTGLSVTMLR